MTFSDFCKLFYVQKRTTCFVGITSQSKLVEYLLRSACGEHADGFLHMTDSTLSKWFEGKDRKVPNDLWGSVKKWYNEDNFVSNFEKNFNPSFLTSLLGELGIDDNEPEKERLVRALAKQFKEIINGNGESAYIVKDVYFSKLNTGFFEDYAKSAYRKNEKTKTLLFAEIEYQFYDFFICNDISYIDIDQSPETKNIIEDVTLNKLNSVSPYTIITGTAGMGKTMMMKHLFLDSLKQCSSTKKLPIMVMLRDFNAGNHNLGQIIFNSVNRFDGSFSEEKLKELLLEGNCQILMDGLDEVNHSSLLRLEEQIDEFVDRYPDNQFVISTRSISEFVELPRFRVLKIEQFDFYKALELVDKLSIPSEGNDCREEFKKHLKAGYYQQFKSFAENPLLLTLMFINYQKSGEIPEKKSEFYEQVYKAMLYNHDSCKLGFKRSYRSAKSPSLFSDVFMELCAKAYRNADYDLSEVKLESYFHKLKQKEKCDQTLMTFENFKYDILHCTCVMVYESQTYHFLHRSFQEYLFAKYYVIQSDTTLKKLGDYMSKRNNFNESNGLELINELDPLKFDKCILLPFLEKIYKDSDDESAYRKLLINGFVNIHFRGINESFEEDYRYASTHYLAWNVPGNVILAQFFGIKLNDYYRIFLEPVIKMSDKFNKYPRREIFGAYIISEDNQKRLFYIRRNWTENPIEDINNFLEMRGIKEGAEVIVDSDGSPQVIGAEYYMPFSEVFKNKSDFSELISVLYDHNNMFYMAFEEIKKHYESFIKQFESEEAFDDDF